MFSAFRRGPKHFPLLCVLLVTGILRTAPSAGAATRELDGGFHHLRIDGPREWDEFPETPSGESLVVNFDAEANAHEQTLRLRQQDVKQLWRIKLNDRQIGQLVRDENDMAVYFAVPAGALADGENTLRIEPDRGGRSVPDDVRIGQIELDSRPLEDVLSEATVEVAVIDHASGESIPGRITVLDHHGTLQSVSAAPDRQIAVRPGTIYTATGRATFQLPAGRYTLHASRGFEYSLATATIDAAADQVARQALAIYREVPTPGYVACDTHIHTLTRSGHGDATLDERMITIAGEGIELPIATDHNTHVDYEPLSRELGVRQYFTPVIGNEVTTPVGHFNVFPIPADAKTPAHDHDDWPSIFEEVERIAGNPVVILNHARDLHSGVRPFGPRRFNDAVAENADGWPMAFDAMEVINSGATQSDPMRLFHDWMALLNRGADTTPVGSSDSHDVARHFVGQARTYIRCDDTDPAAIDVAEAVDNFRRGKVMVSYGLLAEIEIDGRGSGEFVPAEGQQVQVDVRVLGPQWITADRVELYGNGQKLWEERIELGDAAGLPVGVKWSGRWMLDKPPHDVHFVAIARGPGIETGHWKMAKPYQPTSPHWQPQVIGCSGAIWIDADGDGQKTSARQYAQQLYEKADGDLPKLVDSLATYDRAVAAHAAHLHHRDGGSLTAPEVQQRLAEALPAVQAGFRQYARAWRQHMRAQESSGE